MADIETADHVPAPGGTVAVDNVDVAPDLAEGEDGGSGGRRGGGGPDGDGAAPGGGRARTSSKLAYNPALDGIRGIAVGAVLLFHGGYSWARGGYLGVSTFFTLSGFLITSLVVAERVDTGRVRLTAFWARRLRRLFPASALCLAAISLSALVTDQGWERNLEGDVLGALFQVANWRFLFDDRSYGELFATPTPVLHFWSLAIEEQFYWVFPLLAAGVFAFAKGSLRVFAGVLAGLLAVSGALTLYYGTDEQTTIYYATPVRMGEILVGALLALAVHRGLTGGEPMRRLAAAGGVAALAVTGFAWWNVAQDSPKLYQGGLLAYAVVSAALVLAATVPGPVRTLLAVEPLRRLGVISYGVYLYHWPIFLILDSERTGLPPGERLFLVRIGATLAAAIASYFLLERPIRRGWTPRLPAGLPMPALAGGAFVLVAAVAVAVPRISEPPVDAFALFEDGGEDPEPSTIPDSAALGIEVGDSTMFMAGWGLSEWGDENDTMNLLSGSGGLGCGLTRGGEIRYQGNVSSTRADCDAWAETLPGRIDDVYDRYGRVDFAFVMTGPWDVSDRRLPDSDEWLRPGDPDYDEFLRDEYSEITDLLLERGVRVVWVTSPYMDVGRAEEPPPDQPYPESDPARMDRLNQIIREVADEREGAVVVDLQGYMNGLPGGLGGEEDRRLRPDGVHLDQGLSHEVAEWLGPEMLQAMESEDAPPRS